MEAVSVFVKSYKVKSLYKQRANDPTELPISVDELKGVVAEYTGLDIDIYEVDSDNFLADMVRAEFELDGKETPEEMQIIEEYIKDFVNKDRFYGRLNKYKLSADIFVKETGITYCQKRLVATKELAHLIIDNVETQTKSIVDLVDGLIYKNDMDGTSEQIQSENMAYHVALDLLFPWEKRKQAKLDYDAGKVQSIDIAQQFKIPRRDVELCLSDGRHSLYESLYEKLHQLLEDLDLES